MNSNVIKLLDVLPESTKYTLLLREFTFFKVPLLFFVRPSVQRLDDNVCTVKIPFKKRNKNHLNSMFVGVLSSGADCTGVLSAMHKTKMKGLNVVFAVKSLEVDFLKRAEGDTYFTCEQGREISAYVEEALRTGERLNKPLRIVATCPDKTGDDAVAQFTLILSLKAK